jgi:hypothetical protein
MKEHLEKGGHIAGSDGYGFWYWDVGRWPLPALHIAHQLQDIQDKILAIYKALETSSEVPHVLPKIKDIRVSIKDFEDSQGRINLDCNPYAIIIRTLLATIKENLIAIEKIVTNTLS